MTHAYQDTTEEVATSYRRIHGNCEETHVHILSCGEDRYLIVAADVDPRSFSGVAGACLGYEPTLEGAEEKARAWMENRPKGIAPEGGDDDGPSLGQRLWNGLKKLDQSASGDDDNTNA